MLAIHISIIIKQYIAFVFTTKHLTTNHNYTKILTIYVFNPKYANVLLTHCKTHQITNDFNTHGLRYTNILG